MRQPHIPQQSVISLLVQDQLPVPSQPRVDLAVLVEVRRKMPGPVVVVEVKHCALADVDEEPYVLAASACHRGQLWNGRRQKINLLEGMLVTSTQLVVHAAHCLRAKYVPAEQADARVAQLFLRVRASPPIRFLDQAIKVFRKADQFENSWVR